MSYEAGDLGVGIEATDRSIPPVDEANGFVAVRPPVAWLRHSCAEWIIGGPDEVRALIADLQAALARMGG